MMHHKIVQVYPTSNFKVYLYFNTGEIKLYDASNLIQKGVFTKLKEGSIFKESCTVMNGTLAWDLAGDRDSSNVLDLDAEYLYVNCPRVSDPLNQSTDQPETLTT